MSGRPKAPTCPKCDGTTGYEFTMTESHAMTGGWGEEAISGECGLDVRMSLARCSDCGATFHLKTLRAKGLIPGGPAL